MECIGKYGNVFDTPIEELDLSVRSFNALRRSGICTIGDLAQKDEGHFVKIRNMGKESAKEVIEKVERLNIPGFYFGMSEIEIICYGMSEDERENYIKESEVRKEKEKRTEINRCKLLGMKLSELGIKDPVIINRIIQPCTLRELVLRKHIKYYFDESYKNVNELIEGVNRLNIPGLYIGISEDELDKLYVSDVMMSYVEEVSRNEKLKKELYSKVKREELQRENRLMQDKLKKDIREILPKIEQDNEEIKQNNEVLKEKLAILKDLLGRKEKLLEESRRLNEEISSIIKKLSEDTTLNGGVNRARRYL